MYGAEPVGLERAVTVGGAVRDGLSLLGELLRGVTTVTDLHVGAAMDLGGELRLGAIDGSGAALTLALGDHRTVDRQEVARLGINETLVEHLLDSGAAPDGGTIAVDRNAKAQQMMEEQQHEQYGHAGACEHGLGKLGQAGEVDLGKRDASCTASTPTLRGTGALALRGAALARRTCARRALGRGTLGCGTLGGRTTVSGARGSLTRGRGTCA